MRNIKLIFSAFLVILLITSCEITDLNVDPDNPSAESINAGAIYPGMITQSHRNLVALSGRIAGIITQQFDGLDAQQIAYAQYNIGESDIDDTWDFGLYGAGSMKDCSVIMQNNTKETSSLARLYMAANLGLATSLWGDVPYSTAFKGEEGNYTPTYDKQSVVYDTIQALLTKSIADGVKTGIGEFAGNGSVASIDWEKTAHALKARYYIHLTSVNTEAAKNALAEVKLAFSSTAEQPNFAFSSPQQNANPLFAFANQRPSTLGFGTTLKKMMSGDPRLSLYTSGTNFANDANLFWGQDNSPTPLISYWEVKFIEAEAIIRTSGTDEDALTTLKEAVEANMLFVGVSKIDIDAYTNALALTGDAENKIKTIITEKYKALYGNAPIEVWVDYRRTGYPELTANPDAVGGEINESKIIPRRFLYPEPERLTNKTNYDAAVESQGGHNLDDDMWAFPKK